MLLEHRYHDEKTTHHDVKAYHVNNFNRTLSPRRVCRSWRDAFDTVFKPDVGELRLAARFQYVESVRYLISRTKYNGDILYYAMCRNSVFSETTPDKSAMFKFLLDMPQVNLDEPPPSHFMNIEFPNAILYYGDTNQLATFVNHAKYKTEYTNMLLEYNPAYTTVRFFLYNVNI